MTAEDESTSREYHSPKSIFKKQRKVDPDARRANGVAILEVKSVKGDREAASTNNEKSDASSDAGLETETMNETLVAPVGVTSIPTKDRVHGSENNKSIRNGNISHEDLSGKWTKDDGDREDHCQCGCTSSRKCITTLKEEHVKEKLIYLVALVSTFVLIYCMLQVQWFIPYYYTVSLPILITFRYVQYFKMQYQYFLLDFCYLGNLFCYIFIWACPNNDLVFMVVFAVANGPLMSAVVPFRNSLVFHDYDKLTSVYIHVIPAFVSFCLRWYPVATSTHWYRPFAVPANPSFIWLVAVPFVGFLAHFVFYHVLVRLCIRPKEGFIDSYSYLAGKGTGFIAKATGCCGAKGQFWMYAFLTNLYCLVNLLLTRLWYEYFIAHCTFLVFVATLAAWNGGSFYIDVFRKKGFKDDESLDQTV